jgi:hypothetical protein
MVVPGDCVQIGRFASQTHFVGAHIAAFAADCRHPPIETRRGKAASESPTDLRFLARRPGDSFVTHQQCRFSLHLLAGTKQRIIVGRSDERRNDSPADRDHSRTRDSALELHDTFLGPSTQNGSAFCECLHGFLTRQMPKIRLRPPCHARPLPRMRDGSATVRREIDAGTHRRRACARGLNRPPATFSETGTCGNASPFFCALSARVDPLWPPAEKFARGMIRQGVIFQRTEIRDDLPQETRLGLLDPVRCCG